MGRIDCRVVEARNLHNPETFGTPDPYCICTLEGREYRTNPDKNTCNPKWGDVFKFTVADENSSQLHFVIKNECIGRDDPMGEYRLSLSGMTEGKVVDEWLLLQNCKSGEIRVRVQAVDFGDDAPEQPQMQQQQMQFQQQPGMQMQQQPGMPMQQPGMPMQQPGMQMAAPYSGPRLFHQDESGWVYLMMDGMLRHVPDQDVYNRLFSVPLDPNQLIRFQGQNQLFPVGMPLPADACLCRIAGQPEVYLMDNMNGMRMKRHVFDEAALYAHHFDFSKVQDMDPNMIMQTPNGNPIRA